MRTRLAFAIAYMSRAFLWWEKPVSFISNYHFHSLPEIFIISLTFFIIHPVLSNINRTFETSINFVEVPFLFTKKRRGIELEITQDVRSAQLSKTWNTWHKICNHSSSYEFCPQHCEWRTRNRIQLTHVERTSSVSLTMLYATKKYEKNEFIALSTMSFVAAIEA